jgi:hypothetical protein
MSASKKDEQLEFLEEVLFADGKITLEEIEAALKDAGVDVRGFNKRITSMAREIAIRERREGRTAPPYLQEIVRQLDPSGPLQAGFREATQKAEAWIDRMTKKIHPPVNPVLLASYRKGDEHLSKSDQEILEQEKQALLERIKTDDKTD